MGAGGGIDTQPRISHAILLTVGQLSRVVLRPVFLIATARVLGPERFGVYALALAMIEMLAMASGAGYADYLNREASRDEWLGWGLAIQLIWLRAAYAIPLTIVGTIILWLSKYPRFVLGATAALALTLVPRALSENVQGVLRGTGRYLESLIIDLVFGLTLIAGGGLLLLLRGGLASVIRAELAAAGAAAVVAIGFGLRFGTKERRTLGVAQLVRTSAVFNIYRFAVNLYDRLDVLILSKLGGDYATGVYSVAYNPIGAIQFLPYGVLYSLLPALSSSDFTHVAQKRLERAMGLLLSASFVIVMATMVFADVAVPALLGARFREASAALKILIWAVVLRFLNYALNMTLLAKRKERVFVVTSLACLVVNVVGNLALIPIFSWRAAAVLTIATELALLAQNVYWLRRAFGSVPMPLRWGSISFVFLMLLLAMSVGAAIIPIPPLSIGIACLFLFFVYLYRTGMVSEFASAWRAEPRLVELPCSSRVDLT